jgi:hypothetical protein
MDEALDEALRNWLSAKGSESPLSKYGPSILEKIGIPTKAKEPSERDGGDPTS